MIFQENVLGQTHMPYADLTNQIIKHIERIFESEEEHMSVSVQLADVNGNEIKTGSYYSVWITRNVIVHEKKYCPYMNV